VHPFVSVICRLDFQGLFGAFVSASQNRVSRPGRPTTILVIGASGTVGTALLDLARDLGLEAIGTCSATNVAMVERFGATAIDYRAGDFVAAVRGLTAGRMPYENPKLSGTAIATMDGKTFAEALERAIERSKSPPLLNAPTIQHEQLVPASELKKPFPKYRRF
jgi:NADPH:quinone reductase-like Zn-dependent oxidoreductase